MAFGKRSFGKSSSSFGKSKGGGWGRKKAADGEEPKKTSSDGLAIAGRLLGMRDHTEGELLRKLKEKGLDEATVAETMGKLGEMGFLDDARVSKLMASSLVRQGWGPSQVRYRLKEKHLSEVHIDEAMNQWEGEEVWEEAARDRITSKFRKEPAEFTKEEREKAFRHLQYRGYSGSVARAVLFARDH
jgi:regulatory protein